jgi:hypothetical protein
MRQSRRRRSWHISAACRRPNCAPQPRKDVWGALHSLGELLQEHRSEALAVSRLQELRALLESHGLQARAIHGDRLSQAQFRLLLRSNLSHTDEEQLRELLERAARQAEALRLS